MGFYTTPSFFAVLALLIVPAAVLGLTRHNMRYYGLAATVFMCLMLFAGNLQGLVAFAAFLLVAGIATFITFRSFTKGKKSLVLYRFCLAAAIAPLAIYKVSAVFDANIWGFLGISYVTFKSVQVIIEIRDGLIKEMNVADWLYFVMFFPVITSGPIDRSRRFMEDAHKVYEPREYADLLTRGILLLFVGAVYQLVLAGLLNALLEYQPYAAAIGTVGCETADAWVYGLWMFFDFAGYSMMACGASYCFGIRTPRNFRAPFASIDMKDFWNRWHMTLSFWLRDYVFMRFSMFATKRKLFKQRLYTACCGYLVNMTLMGFWHGITPEYILYGVYHGILLAATEAFQKRSAFYKAHKNDTWFKLLSWFITINLVMFGFAIFSGQMTDLVKGL